MKKLKTNFKIGDTYTIGFIRNNYKHNFEKGIITWVNPYRALSNKNNSIIEVKTQLGIKFSNGDKILINDETIQKQTK